MRGKFNTCLSFIKQKKEDIIESILCLIGLILVMQLCYYMYIFMKELGMFDNIKDDFYWYVEKINELL